MKYLISAFKFALTIGLFFLIFRNFDIKISALATEIKDWRYLAGAVCMPLTIIPFISINRWQVFLKVSGIVEGFFDLWRINMRALFQGLLIPSTQGFDFLRIYYIDQRHPTRRGLAGSTVFIERIIGLVMLCLLSLMALPFVVREQELQPILLTIVIISGAVALALGLILSKKVHGFYTGHKFRNKMFDAILNYIDKFHGAIVYFPYRKVLPLSVVLIAAHQLATVFTIYLVFCAYGYAIPFFQHVAIYPIIAILSLAPITVGGFGVREGFFVFFYSLIGVHPTVAVGVSIFQYVILILLPASLGGVLFLGESLFGRRVDYPK